MSHSSWEKKDTHTGLHSSRGVGSIRTPTHALFPAFDEKTWKIRGDDILGILPVKHQKWNQILSQTCNPKSKIGVSLPVEMIASF